MKNAIYYKLLLCLVLIFPGLGIGQSAILDAYVEEALTNNLSIKGEQLRKEKQIKRVAQARRNWMPSVDANASYLFATGGRTLPFPIGDLFNPVNGTLNQLTQSDQFPTNLKNQDIPLIPNNFLDAQLTISQPIFNSSIKYNHLIQEGLLFLNDLDIELQKSTIILQTRVAYFNYLKTIEGFRILDETESLLNDLLSINKKLVKYDKATSEIISDVEFQLANLESERANLIEQQAIAQTYFNIIINREAATNIEIDESLINSFSIENIKLSDAIEKAKQQRKEFKRINIASGINELNKERIEREKLPTLGITGGIGLQTESFDFDNGGPLYTLAFGASVNLFDGGRRKKRMEEIEVDQLLLNNGKAQLSQQVEIQVTQIYYALKSLESRFAAERAASESARKTYSIIKSKYENNKAILLEVTDAQNKLITSDLRQALTKYDYLIKLAELENAQGAD